VFAAAWTSRAAGGSDSSCYVLQAEAFAHGHASLHSPIAALLPDLPNAIFAPTGFVPSPRAFGDAVPICAPGLALAMAGPFLLWPGTVFLVVPVAAAWLVWLTFQYARRVGDDVAGAGAAILVACSPIFLYQAVQPMSAVPAAAAWTAALVAATPFAAGAWMSMAILIRPNLALLVVVLLIFRLTEAGGKRAADGGEGRPADRLTRLLRFGLALSPGLLVLVALNAARYGSPVATGYGSTDALFAWAHVPANLTRYPRWLIETQTPFVLLALAAPWVLRRDSPGLRLSVAALVATALLAATYLAYTVFDDWWYLRFLLPALPTVIGLSMVVLMALVRAVPRTVRLGIACLVCVALTGWYVHVARARHALDLQALEARFALAGEYAGRALPRTAVILAVQESGSIRFHGHRDTLAWDAIPPDQLDATVQRLREAGRVVYLALEEAEEPPFRLRFAGQRAGRLDWRPDAEIRAAVRVHFYTVPLAR
jgi:hypothetical protein